MAVIQQILPRYIQFYKFTQLPSCPYVQPRVGGNVRLWQFAYVTYYCSQFHAPRKADRGLYQKLVFRVIAFGSCPVEVFAAGLNPKVFFEKAVTATQTPPVCRLVNSR